ncbi:hypothetical protein PGQ11_001428 [Apiospora arundinis]|uniref:SUZ domain-containing protein n=1 Tax=Apiospora arundinis TaxID=335852 RepID=A0ABR2JN66_9PEZI
MVKKSNVPNAWEDDWESQADKEAQEPAAPAPPAPLTKKERLAQHAELNRKIWETADTPGNGAPLQFLAASSPAPPLAQPFKAPMTVLARKPTTLNEGYDDDDDEASKKPPETPEEIRARQQREREEKQKRYDEMRAKIFGETANSAGSTGAGAGAGPSGAAGRGGSGRSSGNSTPGNVTPPTQRSGDSRRGRGRGRGGYRGGRGGGGGGGGNNVGGEGGSDRFADRGGERSDYQRPISQSGAGASSELYDPSYSPKPTSTFDRRANNMGGGAPLSGRSTPRDDDQVIRAPRGPPASGPDNGGRGGFGFARRGG